MTDNTDNTTEIIESENKTETSDTDGLEMNEPQKTDNIITDSTAEHKLIPDTAPYQISNDIYREAYKCYQKHYVFPKNRIFQIIFLLLAIDFGYNGAMHPDNKIAFFLMALCAAFIFILWYNPRRMRRSVMDVVREMEGDEYTFSMDDEKMTFCTVSPENIQDVPNEEISYNSPTEIYYSKDLYVVEKCEYFLICRGKQAFYVLPKYALYDNQAEIVRFCLESKIGKHFRCKI